MTETEKAELREFNLELIDRGYDPVYSWNDYQTALEQYPEFRYPWNENTESDDSFYSDYSEDALYSETED